MKKTPFHIFYTDDDKDDQFLFKEVVTSINPEHKVYQNHGGELLDMLRTPPPKPDLIFLDLNMPHKNGFEVLAEMRKDIELENIPVVIFSTSNSETVIDTCRQLGASMYVSKPEAYPELVSRINSVLNLDWKNYRNAGIGFTLLAN
jgi:CheY-like chemotaxis protein